MTQRIERLAVLFADICGSTSLYEELGDKAARRLVSECIAVMNMQAMAHQGTLIKTIGDEIMCIFPSAEAAFNAACAMQHAINLDREDNDQSQPLHIRIGFHYGDVIREPGDVHGDTVNVAARVTALSSAGQIFATHAVNDALPEELQEKMRHIMRSELKGKQEKIDIFLVAWQEDDGMSTRILPHSSRKQQSASAELKLNYGGQVLAINQSRKRVVIGREAGCDIIVSGKLISRQHASVELRSGKYVLSDHSANGTYVCFADGQEVFLVREEVTLQGKGSISLGQSCTEGDAEIIEYTLEAIKAPKTA